MLENVKRVSLGTPENSAIQKLSIIIIILYTLFLLLCGRAFFFLDTHYDF